MNTSKMLLAFSLSCLMTTSVYATELPNTTQTTRNVDINSKSIQQNQNQVPVNVEAEPTILSVTIPSSFPVYLDESGQISLATDTKIINNSFGPIRVESAVIKSLSNWELTPDSLAAEKVNSRKYNFVLQNQKLTSENSFDATQLDSIPGKQSIEISYESEIAPQSKELSENIAEVIFTIAWDKAENVEVIDKDNIALTSENLLSIVGEEGLTSNILKIPSTYTDEKGDICTITSIADNAFYNIETAKGTLPQNITELKLPDTIKTIGANAFRNNTNLTWVDMGSGTEEIGNYAFADCKNAAIYDLGTASDLQSIGVYAFKNLNYIELGLHETKLHTIGSSAFYGAYIKDSVFMPPTLENIGTGVFQNSTVTYVDFDVIPGTSKLKTLPTSTFSGCTELYGVYLPESLESIGSSAFYNTSKLQSVDNFGALKNLKSIGSNAFMNSSTESSKPLKLRFMDDLNHKDTVTFGDNVFKNSGIVEFKFNVTNTVKLGLYDFMGCSSLEVWQVSGPVTNGTLPTQLLYNANSLYDIVFPSNTKTIGSSAFYKAFTNTSTILEIPTTVTTINSTAFSGCESLNLIIPTGSKLTTIGNGAFLKVWNVDFSARPTLANKSGFPWGATNYNT